MGLTIYKASAGSGKTYTLTREYILIALRNDYAYQNILAITFTVKATQEMKDRILQKLKALAEGKDEQFLQDIIKASKDTAFPYDEEYVKNKSRLVYSNMLHNYGRFEVSTLDSFFVRTVKSIAKELGLPINFEIELDHDKTMEAMVEKLFNEAKNNKPLRKWLNNYAEHKMDGDQSWQIKRDILKDGKQVFSEKYHLANKDSVGHSTGDGETGLAIIISEAKKEKKILEAQVEVLCKKALKLVADSGLAHTDFSRKLTNQFEKGVKIFNDDFRLNGFLVKNINGTANWYTAKAPQETKSAIDAISERLNTLGQEIIELGSTVSTYASFLKKIFIYGILDYLNTLLVDYRDEKNLLLLSDLSALLSSLIGNNDAPFIFEKAGSRYQHIFIDEFQDTSDLQWKNVLPLVLNALSTDGEVLIVGDVKQSIYRWRGGNLNLLLQDIKADLLGAYNENTEQTLNTNFRTDGVVVDFNNKLFSHLRDNIAEYAGSSEGELYQKAYKEIEQKIRPKVTGQGYVTVNFIDRTLDYEEEMGTWLVESIESAKRDGFELRDMLVLVETKANAQKISKILQPLDYKVITDRSLLLRNSEKVLFLISCAQWLSDSKNQVAQSQMLYLYRVIFDKVDGSDLHPTFDVRREDWLDDFLASMPEDFDKQLDAWKSKPVYEALEDIIFFFGLHEKADSFIQKFQDEILVLMEKGETSIEDMLKWWQANRDDLSISAPEGENAIQIMTVHKSKGLESPIVFYPFSSKKYDSKGIFWTDQIPERFAEFNFLPIDFGNKLKDNEFNPAYELELSEAILERLNVHYVAFTRAKNRLYICGTYKADAKKAAKPGETKSLEAALLTSLEFLGFGSWDTDDISKTFTLGKPEQRKVDDDEPDHVVPEALCSYPSNPYTNKLQLRQGSKRFFELKEQGLESERQRGLIIHSLLETLDQPKILKQQIEKLQSEGIINSNEVQFVEETFAKLMQDPTFRSFFDPEWEAFVEREILLEGKSYRPDRVITNDKSAKVIDYKSENETEKHKAQVKKYAELLSQMGYTDIEKYLVYTISNKIVQVQ